MKQISGPVIEMSSQPSLLEGIIQEVRDGFVEAKSDGKLEAAEVIHIASIVSQKIYKLGGLSMADKKALVMLSLKKGLDAAGGLHGLEDLAGLGPEALATAERQVLNAAIASVDGLLAAVPRLFAPLKGALASCLPFCSSAENTLTALDPKDAALIHEAFLCVATVTGKPAAPAEVVTKVAPPVENQKDVIVEAVAASDVKPTLESAVAPPLLNTAGESTPPETLPGTAPSQ